MDAKLPLDIFENVMQLGTEGCKAIANYIREVMTFYSDFLTYEILARLRCCQITLGGYVDLPGFS